MTNADLDEIRAMLRARSEQERRRERSRFGGVFIRKPAPSKPSEPPPLDPPPARVGAGAHAEPHDRRLFGQRRTRAEPPLVLDAPLALDGHAAAGVEPPRPPLERAEPPETLPADATPDLVQFDPKVAAVLHLEGAEILARLERLLAVERAGVELKLGAARAN